MGETPQHFHGRHLEDAGQHVKMVRLWLATRKPPAAPAPDGNNVPRYNQRDQALISYFASTLKDTAFTWFNTLTLGANAAPANVGTVDELIELFEIRFQFDETNKWREIGRMNQKRQGPTQSTEEFITEVQNIGATIRATPQEVETTVMNGLRPELQEAVLIHDLLPDNKLQQIRKWATIAERSSRSQFNSLVATELTDIKATIQTLNQKLDQVQIRPIETPRTQFYTSEVKATRRERSASPYPRSTNIDERQSRGETQNTRTTRTTSQPPQAYYANQPENAYQSSDYNNEDQYQYEPQEYYANQPENTYQSSDYNNEDQYQFEPQNIYPSYDYNYEDRYQYEPRGPPRRGMQPARRFYGGPRPSRNRKNYNSRPQRGYIQQTWSQPYQGGVQNQPSNQPYQGGTWVNQGGTQNQPVNNTQQPFTSNQNTNLPDQQYQQQYQQPYQQQYLQSEGQNQPMTNITGNHGWTSQTSGCRNCTNTVRCTPGTCWAQGRDCYRCGQMNHVVQKCRARLPE
jgi:hypothetical protein